MIKQAFMNNKIASSKIHKTMIFILIRILNFGSFRKLNAYKKIHDTSQIIRFFRSGKIESF